MKSQKYFYKFLFNYCNFIRIMFLFSLGFIFSFEYLIKNINSNIPPKFKQLPSGNVFVLLYNGIYIYSNDFSNYSLIEEFNSNEIIKNEEESNKTIISEIKNETNYYILCLIKDRLYLFDNETNNISKIYHEINSAGDYYNLIPYKLDMNLLYYIIIFSKKTNDCTYWLKDYPEYSFNLYYLSINLLTNENTQNKSKELLKKCYTNFIFNCQIMTNQYMFCIFLIEWSSEFKLSVFNIPNFELQEKYENVYSDDKINKIMQIKPSSITETNDILICYYWELKTTKYFFFHDYSSFSSCFLYSEEIKKVINIIEYISNTQILDTYYFKETNSFIPIFIKNGTEEKLLSIYKINETSKENNDYYEETFQCKKINNINLIYNQSIEGYNLIIDCYKNDNDWKAAYNITIFSSFSPHFSYIPKEEDLLFILKEEEIEEELEEENNEDEKETEKDEEIEEEEIKKEEEIKEDNKDKEEIFEDNEDKEAIKEDDKEIFEVMKEEEISFNIKGEEEIKEEEAKKPEETEFKEEELEKEKKYKRYKRERKRNIS